MKTTTKILFAGGLLAALGAPLVAEAGVNFDVVIGVPGPVYVAPQPVYYPPQVVYAPAPRIIRHHRDRDRDRHYRYEDRRHW
jgi:hypothetical protein